jgi:mRNA-degrading endonuclease RelE of RelBE toxin-antitoxin system
MVSYSVAASSLLFVETEAFTERVRELLDDDTYRAFQNDLVMAPEKGAVMPGCGGLRKVRIGEPGRGKGKRGGCRVIYLLIPELERIDLLAIYSKDMQDNLTGQQRKAMKTMAEQARHDALKRRSLGKEG